MYCPRCSNQQTSDSARYCTKCGFQISAVKDLIANDGMPAVPVATNPIPFAEDSDRRIRRRSRIVNIVFLIAIISLLSDLHNGSEILPRSIVGAVLIAILCARVFVKARHSITSTKGNETTLADSRVNPVQQPAPKRIVTAE